MKTVDALPASLHVEPSWRNGRFRLALLGIVAFLFIAAASFQDRDSGHGWGISVVREGDGLRVVWVQPSGLGWDAGIRPGDFIIQADGLPAGRARFTDSDQPAEISVVSQRSGNISSMAFPEAPDLGLALALIATGAVFVIIGSSVLLWAPKADEAVAFYAFSSVSAVVYLLAVSANSGHLWNVRLQFVVTTISFYFLTYFFLVFPCNRLRNRAPISYLILFVPAFLLVALFFVFTFVWPSLYDLLRPIVYASHLSLSLVAVGAFLWGFIELQREGKAGLLRVPILGTVVAAVGLAVTTILPLGLGLEPFIAPQMSALFGVLIPASFAYAILRHRLLGLSGIIRRALINFLVGVALLACFTGLSVAVNRTFRRSEDHELWEIGAQVLFVALALLVMPALYRAMQRFVDRAFFRDVYEHDKALHSITRTLSSARSADELATDVVATATSTLNLAFAAVALPDVGGRPELIASTPELAPEVASDILVALERMAVEGSEQRIMAGRAGGMAVAYVPLISSSTYTGLLCLGPKRSGLPFSQRDMSFLTTVATELAMGLDNARLLQTVQRNLAELQASAAKLQEGQVMLRELNHRLLMAEEKERRRLAADLHDEPLQRIMMLLRHVESCVGVRKAHNAVCRDLASEAATALRRACVDFHPPLLEDLGLEAALDWLISNTNKSSNVIVRAKIDPALSLTRLRPEAQIALYRVVQEALNNVVRHAEGTEVLVRLLVTDNTLFVSVKDDGKGFQMPESLSNLSIDGHMGLIGMRERMESAGGQLRIFTARGAGTEVLATLKHNSEEGAFVG